MKTNSRIARRYCCSVRSWLPCGKMRRVIMKQIQETVNTFVLQNPDADFEAIQAQFGQPKDIAVSYVENMGTAEVLKGLHVRRRVLTIILATALALLVSWTICVTWATLELKNAADAPYVEITIE